MSYYPDLSPYVYTSTKVQMLNVGWLAAGHPFPTGATDPAVRDHLVRLASSPVNVMRGLHYCDFCDVESPLPAETLRDPVGVAYLGTGEVHVESGGLIFVAPTLVIHYIDAHDYRPPAAFCEAVRAATADPEMPPTVG